MGDQAQSQLSRAAPWGYLRMSARLQANARTCLQVGRMWLPLVAILLTAGGCTSVAGSSADMVKLAVEGHRNQMPTAAAVAAKPYYQMFASTSSGQGVLILGNLDGTREDWYGRDGVVLFIRDGQIIKTTGLPQNLEDLHASQNNPFARGLQHLSGPLTIALHMDWSGYRYGVPVQATLTRKGTREVSILGQTRRLLEVDESLTAPIAHWRAINQYWVDPANGFIWKSVQHIAPNQTLTLVQLKPYVRAQP